MQPPRPPSPESCAIIVAPSGGGAAAVAAAAAAAIATYPLDALRIRWQTTPASPSPLGLSAFASRVARAEGLAAAFVTPGLGAGVAAAAAAAAVGERLRGPARGHFGAADPWGGLGAAAAAAAAAAALSTPLSLLKVRSQAVAGPALYRSDLAATTLVGWWRGAAAVGARGGLLCGGAVLGYDAADAALAESAAADGLARRTAACFAAAVAAAAAAAPADALATRFQALAPGQTAEDVAAAMREGESMLQAAAAMHKAEGTRAFYRGLAPNALRLFLVFAAYDALRAPMDGT